ncbi:nuclear transport factor 2 family protein [Spirosoma taeanense]|uniref:Nuclear transport factor 2 family protein n=1 Tax=Spirosoma taeanense TaxID=2735870 RepID=A0A6M5Y7P7_9BACT|nr:nuclear transport factor 2 family protein [Spirosoma taeanense]QJW90367.1 nuclear transport factor 2 family protein [Spirosoma taeanense]
MKYLTSFLIAAVLLGGSITSAVAQKNEKGVADAVERLRKAMIDPTEVSLQAIASDKLSYGHSSGKIEDKAEFIRALVSNESDFKTIDLTEQTIALVDNTALVRHKLSAETANSGTPGTARLSVLLVWVYQQGGWKLLARQAVKI